jgi:predicted MFS family arabinose efflux permease
VAFGGACYAAGLALASGAQSFAQFWMGAGILVGLGLGGASFGVVHAVVARAYPDAQRGRALGRVGAATAAGQLAMLIFTEETLGHLGWREALLWHAVAACGIVAASACMKEERTKGIAPQAAGGTRAVVSSIRRAEFWFIALPFAFSGFQVMATMTHLPAMGSAIGWSAGTSLAALLAVTGSAFFGQLYFGRLADRWPRHRVLAVIYAARCVLSLVPATLPLTSAVGVTAFFFVLGLVWMSPIPVASGLTAQIFGTANLASIFSLVFLCHQIGGFAGTWLAALLREATGSYSALWWIAAALHVLGTAGSLMLERRRGIAPQQKSA